MSDTPETQCGTTHYAGCACHEKDWQNKWQCAVELAAQAEAKLDALVAHHTRSIISHAKEVDALKARLAMLLFHMIKPPEPDCTCVNSLPCFDCSNYRELRDVIAKAKKVFKEGSNP